MFVIDYLSGDEATVKYLEEHSEEEFHVPADILHEGIEGTVRSSSLDSAGRTSRRSDAQRRSKPDGCRRNSPNTVRN
jgi:hypothetical protein